MAKATRVVRKPKPPPVEKFWRIELTPREAFIVLSALKSRSARFRKVGRTAASAFVRLQFGRSERATEELIAAIRAGVKQPIVEEESE
jgi:hypothetical protein